MKDRTHSLFFVLLTLGCVPIPGPEVAPAPAYRAHSNEVAATARTDGLESNLDSKPPRRDLGSKAPCFRLPVANPEVSGYEYIDVRALTAAKGEHRKTLVLNFSASWCKPCRKELADFKQRAKALFRRSALLVIVVVDKTDAGRTEMLRYLMETLKVPFPIIVDKHHLVASRFGIDSLPVNVVLDDKAQFYWQSEGYLEGTFGQLLRAIDDLAGKERKRRQ